MKSEVTKEQSEVNVLQNHPLHLHLSRLRKCFFRHCELCFAFYFGYLPTTELFLLRESKEISSSHMLDVCSETWEQLGHCSLGQVRACVVSLVVARFQPSSSIKSESSWLS